MNLCYYYVSDIIIIVMYLIKQLLISCVYCAEIYLIIIYIRSDQQDPNQANVDPYMLPQKN